MGSDGDKVKSFLEPCAVTRRTYAKINSVVWDAVVLPANKMHGNILHEYKGDDQLWTLYCMDIVVSIAVLARKC
jgi:hypothetical protein